MLIKWLFFSPILKKVLTSYCVACSIKSSGDLVNAYSDDTDPSSGHVDPPLGKKVKELDGLTILPFFS